MPGHFLCLELNNFGIKAMIVESSYKLNSIKDYCHVLFKDLPDFKKNSDHFDSGMDMVARQFELQTCSTAIIFVSPLSICFRNIDFPFGSEKKIKQILPFELETLLPLTNEGYISDFHMLDIKKESNFILSASIVEAQVEKYFLKLGSFGIKPLIVTLGGYANAINFLQKNKDTSNFVFLHVADYEITFVLVTNRTPCTVRTFSTALYSPENLTLSVEQSIMAFNQKTGADISFDIYLSSDEDNPEAKHIYNALKTKYQNLKIKKINSNDFLINLSPDKTVKHLFNFCQGQYGTSSFVKTYLPNIAVGIVLFFIVFGLFLVNTIFDYSILNKKIAAVDSRTLSIFMATFPDNKKIYDPYLQMKANVREAIKKSGVVKDKDQPIKNKSVKLLEIMNELSKRIDSSIDIEAAKFLFNNGRLFLSGSTDNFNNVDNIKTKLESSDLFEKVSISSAAADKNGDRVNFKFIIEI